MSRAHGEGSDFRMNDTWETNAGHSGSDRFISSAIRIKSPLISALDQDNRLELAEMVPALTNVVDEARHKIQRALSGARF
jgi:hypothetical protein